MFNNYYIRREVKHTVKDAIEDLAIGEVIEDYLERIIWEAIPIIAQSEMNEEVKKVKFKSLFYKFTIVKINKKQLMHSKSI